MNESRLTKDAITLLRALHKEYKRRRKDCLSKQSAVFFGGSTDIQQEIMSEWSIADIVDACYELYGENLIDCIPGDDDIQIVVLTNSGIEYAENRFINAAKAVWNFLKELIPFIPSGY